MKEGHTPDLDGGVCSPLHFASRRTGRSGPQAGGTSAGQRGRIGPGMNNPKSALFFTTGEGEWARRRIRDCMAPPSKAIT